MHPPTPQKQQMSGATLSSPEFQAQQRITCCFFAAEHIGLQYKLHFIFHLKSKVTMSEDF